MPYAEWQWEVRALACFLLVTGATLFLVALVTGWLTPGPLVIP